MRLTLEKSPIDHPSARFVKTEGKIKHKYDEYHVTASYERKMNTSVYIYVAYVYGTEVFDASKMLSGIGREWRDVLMPCRSGLAP